MNLMTKLLSSFITLAFAIIGGIVTGWVFLTNTMDVKDAKAVGALRSEISEMRNARNEEINGIVNTLNARFDGQQAQMDNVQANIRILLRRNQNSSKGSEE